MDDSSRARAADRALLIGGRPADADRLASQLGPAARVICFAADRSSGEAARAAILARAPDVQVAVMLGDPALLVHKVAGPFDLIVDAHPGGAARQARLRVLAGEGGEIYG